MVAMETKKMVFLWVPCQQLLREKFRVYNVYKYSLWVSTQSNQYFFRKCCSLSHCFMLLGPWTPATSFVTTRKLVKILLFPKFKMFVIKKTPFGTSIFSILQYGSF